eukprot:1954696-Prymnesium_polylepis.1
MLGARDAPVRTLGPARGAGWSAYCVCDRAGDAWDSGKKTSSTPNLPAAAGLRPNAAPDAPAAARARAVTHPGAFWPTRFPVRAQFLVPHTPGPGLERRSASHATTGSHHGERAPCAPMSGARATASAPLAAACRVRTLDSAFRVLAPTPSPFPLTASFLRRPVQTPTLNTTTRTTISAIAAGAVATSSCATNATGERALRLLSYRPSPNSTPFQRFQPPSRPIKRGPQSAA